MLSYMRGMRTANADISAVPDLPDRCQDVRLARQRCRCPRFRFQKLCDFGADRAEDARYR